MQNPQTLTPISKRILEYIATRIENDGYAPTYREMLADLPHGLSTISRNINHLVELGFLIRTEKAARGLSLGKTWLPHGLVNNEGPLASK